MGIRAHCLPKLPFHRGCVKDRPYNKKVILSACRLGCHRPLHPDRRSQQHWLGYIALPGIIYRLLQSAEEAECLFQNSPFFLRAGCVYHFAGSIIQPDVKFLPFRELVLQQKQILFSLCYMLFHGFSPAAFSRR